MTLRLDRMEIEEVGANPVRLAGAIHRQLGMASGAVPVVEVARALDIREIRVEMLSTFEGALIAPPERGYGSILVNDVGVRRRRFTVAHELGHFLSPHHEQTDATGFWCSRADLRTHWHQDQNRHARQEAEANTFAIELLAPRGLTRPFCGSAPDLGKALAMSASLEISREAGARRYVEHHTEALAVVFSQDGRVRYTQAGSTFPRLALHRDDVLPELPDPAQDGLSRIETAEPADWLAQPSRLQLTAQTLHQREGWATSLLHLQGDEDEPDDDVEDSFDRFTRFV